MSAQSTIAENEHGAPTGFVRRWLYSTNHKDIGTMYIIFAIIAAFIGGGFSVFMRMELMQPGIQYIVGWTYVECLYNCSWPYNGFLRGNAWAHWRLW